MRKEWKILLTTIMYFTRIRLPRNIGHQPGYLQQTPRYFPMIGWIVGGISALTFWIVARYLSVNVGVLLSIVAGILTTGAFHEDGFADVCDGFGGGWTRDKILLIMKDSRIGAFGGIGLLMMLGMKFTLLLELSVSNRIVPVIIAAHSLSRLMPVGLIQWMSNVTDEEHNKSKPVTSRRLTPIQLGFACVVAMAPFIFLPWQWTLVVIPAIFTSFAMAKYFTRWIGGYTGDCLGAVQQATEIVIYLGFLAALKYLS